MKKLVSLILALCMLCTLSTASAQGNSEEVEFPADGKWLPDPGNIFGVDAEFFMVKTEKNEVTYASYLYTFDATMDEFADMLFTYQTVMMDLDCTIKQYKRPENAIRYEGYFFDDLPAAELLVCVKDNAKGLAQGDTGTFLIGLMIPVDDWYFEVGKYSDQVKNGETRCIECLGNGLCKYCGGTGRANYGNGYETCVVCDGNGICNICDGKGSY